MSIRERNLEKLWLTCIRCGRRMWTDRCHRTCPRCRKIDDCRGQRGIAYGVELTER